MLIFSRRVLRINPPPIDQRNKIIPRVTVQCIRNTGGCDTACRRSRKGEDPFAGLVPGRGLSFSLSYNYTSRAGRVARRQSCRASDCRTSGTPVSRSCGFNTARIMSYSGESCARNRRCGTRRHASLDDSLLHHLLFATHLPRPRADACRMHFRGRRFDGISFFFSDSRFV